MQRAPARICGNFPAEKQSWGKLRSRELREELNIEIKPLREYCRSVCGELSFVFIEAEIISGEPQLSVHEKMRWVSPGELTAFEWCPADRTVAEMLSANCS